MQVFARLPALRRWHIGFGVIALLMLTATMHADPPQAKKDDKKVVQLPVGNLDTAEWLKFSTKPLEKGEIDRLILAELTKLNIKPAALTTDEQFIRRAYLDLTGKLPNATDVIEFV